MNHGREVTDVEDCDNGAVGRQHRPLVYKPLSHDPLPPCSLAGGADFGIGQTDLCPLQSGLSLGDLGPGNPMLCIVGPQLRLGRIQFGLRGDFLPSKRLDPAQFAPRNVQTAATLLEVGFGYIQLGAGLIDLLNIFLVLQNGDQLVVLDLISDVGIELLQASADLWGDDKL